MTEGPSLAFHAAAPDGSDARVLLLERTDDPARIRVTEWAAGAYAQPGRAGGATPREVEERLEGWRRAGWRFSEAPSRVLAWLRHPG